MNLLEHVPHDLRYAVIAVAAAAGLSTLYAVGNWIMRPSCERCGSHKVRFAGARGGKNPPYRCLSCGWSNN